MGGATYARMLWRRIPLVIGVTLLIGIIGPILSSRQPKAYQSTATVALLPDSNASAASLAVYGDMSRNLLPTYGQVVRSRTFLADAAREVDGATADELHGAISVTPIPNAPILKISARSPDPARAAAMAQAVAANLVSYVSGNNVLSVKVVDNARVPDAPVSPRPTLVLVASVLVGLMAGAAAAIAWERLFARVRSADEVERLTGLPVLGVVLDDPLLRQNRTIIVGTGTAPSLEENLRAVASNLVFALSEETEPIVVFTGLNPGDGKSTVTANIAVALSELGLRVRLIDADLRKPVQHEVFRVPNRRGLSDTLRADIAPVELSLPTRFPGLTVVPAGPPLTAQRDELNVYLHRLGKFHAGVDVTIVDSPPLRASEAVRLLATQSNAMVLVVRPGGPPRELRAAVDSVRRVGINVVGVVINRAKRGAAETGALPYYGYDHAAGHVAGGDPERPATAHRSDDARTLSEAVAEAVGAPGRAAPAARPGPGGSGPTSPLGADHPS